jgi:hypothetical protein
MLRDWTVLSEELQLMVSREALHRAAGVVAEQADELASEMETGSLCDRGGPEALRLFAAMMRAARDDAPAFAGHA